MTGLIILATLISMIVVSFVAVTHKSLPDAIILFMGVGLGSVILFYLFQAPDVAMTEAVIGAGISSLIFLIALKHLGEES